MDTVSSKRGKRIQADDSDDATSLQIPSKRPRTGESLIKLRYDSYTIAWICALPIEMAAANAMLDNIHQQLPLDAKDSNSYILGNIGQHNIVVACLPANRYGTNPAAVVATNLARTFPSIKVGLLVGIGGGVPGKVDIRLGDIVVGNSVVQHDLGKVVPGSRVHRTGMPKYPPTRLSTAVSRLQTNHEYTFSRVPTILQEMLIKHPKMIEYIHPGSAQDKLFRATCSHNPEVVSCDSCDTSMLVSRHPREDNNPVIHYGNIASGNQLMKDAICRDDIARDHDVICFEMEAAGLVDTLPCLVIRGICDYSDSHKNKQWQRYAAATAAAYAKELLIEAIPEIVMEPSSGSDRPCSAEAETTLAARLATGTQWTALKILEFFRVLAQRQFYKQVPLSPVLVIDSRGCRLPFHLETVDSKELFVEILKHRFKDLGTKKIERGEWALEDQHSGQRLDLSKDWQSIIKPNQVLRMSMIFRRQNKGSTKCPSCGLKNPGLSSDTVQCRRCSLNYRRIEEIHEIQIDDVSIDIKSEAAQAKKENAPGSFQNTRPLKPQSPEDDIRRYKHVQLVDIDFKFGPTTKGQQTTKKTPKLRLGDLADTDYLAEKLTRICSLSEAYSIALSQEIDSHQSRIHFPRLPSFYSSSRSASRNTSSNRNSSLVFPLEYVIDPKTTRAGEQLTEIVKLTEMLKITTERMS